MNTEETTIYIVIDQEYPAKDCIWSASLTIEEANKQEKALRDCVADQNRLTEIIEVPLALAGLRIAAASSEGDTSVEPGPEATPKESVISVEALEKEGWEKNRFGAFTKGAVYVKPCAELAVHVEITTISGYARSCQGVSSMQDLRQLEQLVNGKQ